MKYFRLVLTAASPNIAGSVLLKIKEGRLGRTKDIHSLIVTAATCNEAVAIFLFGVAVGIVFYSGTYVHMACSRGYRKKKKLQCIQCITTDS